MEHNYLAPWQWVSCELHDANGNCVADDGSAWGEYGVKLKPNSPNGRLVAAAPDLLAAATALLAWADMQPVKHPQQAEMRNAARAAIKKATTT